MSERTYSDEDVIQVLTDTKGNISLAARQMEVSRTYMQDLINRRKPVRAHLDDLREGMVDKAEENIFDALEKGDKGISQFVVTTLGKNRGWATRNELTGADGKDLTPPNITFAQYAPEPEEEAAGEAKPDVADAG